MVSGSLAIMSATIGVSTAPGHTALMQMPLKHIQSAALFAADHAVFRCVIDWPGRDAL